MSLSINESKVAELLKSSETGYTVSDVPLVIANSTPVYPVTYEVSGTVYTAPALVTPETKERLLAARRQIEESGVPLKGLGELAREIDEMRGRR
jgi:hypothetical protein